MITNQPRIVGLGNALVDVVADVDADLLRDHRLRAGGMHLVDDAAADALYRKVGPGIRQSGGSVANTIAHASAIGAATSFVGKVADDELGDTFAQDFASLGVTFGAPRLARGPGTGRCVVLVTPGGERTMSTYLGAAQSLGPADVESAMPKAADILLVEGYLWDSPDGPAAIDAGVARARACGAQVALTPSDAGCVSRNLAEMRGFIARHCDVLIGNEDEVQALAGADTALDALAWAASQARIAAVTQSAAGSLVCAGDASTHVPATPPPDVVDSTGAGDAYAAGFLYVLAAGGAPLAAGHLGADLAAQVVGHHGARLSRNHA